MSPPVFDLERPARIPTSTFGNDEDLRAEWPQTWNLEKFQHEVTSSLKDLFNGALNESADQLAELLQVCKGFADELGVVAVRAAIDQNAAEQKAVIKLFDKLHKKGAITQTDMVRTFEKLFCAWENITIDAPMAPRVIIETLLFCEKNGCVAPIILSKVPEALINVGLKRDDEELPKEGKETLIDTAAALKEFKRQLRGSLEEYFVTSKVEMLDRRLRELGQKQYRHELVKMALIISFDQQDVAGARDAALDLFRHLAGESLLTKDDLQWGVSRVLASLHELEIDCPKASEYTIDALAGMVADELLGVDFLRRCLLLRIGGGEGLHGLAAIQRKTPEFSKKNLDTQSFKKEIHTMIIEFFDSADKAEFTRRIRELAPLPAARGATIIRKIMQLAMEHSTAECESAVGLMLNLCHEEEITEDVIEMGFDEMYRMMPDILLDVPDAREMAKAFVVEAQKVGILGQTWEIPSPETQQQEYEEDVS